MNSNKLPLLFTVLLRFNLNISFEIFFAERGHRAKKSPVEKLFFDRGFLIVMLKYCSIESFMETISRQWGFVFSFLLQLRWLFLILPANPVSVSAVLHPVQTV